MMNLWQKFTQLPDLGRWHRHILKNEKLLQDQRDHAPPSPYESEAHKQARAYLEQNDIPIRALRIEQ